MNALARQCVEVIATDASVAIDVEQMHQAKEILIRRKDMHLDSLGDARSAVAVSEDAPTEATCNEYQTGMVRVREKCILGYGELDEVTIAERIDGWQKSVR